MEISEFAALLTQNFYVRNFLVTLAKEIAKYVGLTNMFELCRKCYHALYPIKN